MKYQKSTFLTFAPNRLIVRGGWLVEHPLTNQEEDIYANSTKRRKMVFVQLDDGLRSTALAEARPKGRTRRALVENSERH